MFGTLSETLQPYKELVGSVASVVTIGQFFAGTFVCKDIHKQKSTKGIPATPFVGGIVIGSLMLKHGLLLNDSAMLRVNLSAIALNILYTVFYYQYSEDKYNEVLKPLGIGTAIMAVFLGYASVESPENIEFRYGLVVTILMLLLLGAPLLDIKEILEKRDASSIPFPMTFMATIVSFLWLLYGIILENDFMIVQNVIGFILSLVQLVLIYKFPKTSLSKKSEKNAKKD